MLYTLIEGDTVKEMVGGGMLCTQQQQYMYAEAGMWAMAVNSHIWLHGTSKERKENKRNSSLPRSVLPPCCSRHCSIFFPLSHFRWSNPFLHIYDTHNNSKESNRFYNPTTFDWAKIPNLSYKIRLMPTRKRIFQMSSQHTSLDWTGLVVYI